MKIIMIIFLISGGVDGGASMKEVGGFTTMQTCAAAAKTLPAYVWENGYVAGGTIKAVCLEVK